MPRKVKSLKIEAGRLHREHRSKKGRKFKSLNSIKDYKEKKVKLLLDNFFKELKTL